VSVPSLTVIVVSRGLVALLRHCVSALDRALAAVDGPIQSRFVLVDNASPIPYSDVIAQRAETTVIRFDVGQSFARANNPAARARPADMYLLNLLMNNDVLLGDGALAGMWRIVLDHADVAVCGTRLLFPDGTLQHCGVVFGPSSTGPYHYRRRLPADVVSRAEREWQAVTGACMLVRGDVWRLLGGLDEAYPFGLEDIDLCLRARQRGWRVVCSNGADSLHFESMTPGRVALDVGSRRLFMERWGGRYAIDG
jgi:GT2 family glycosyltransferase